MVQAATAVPVRGPQAPRWAIPASVTLRGRTWATLDAVAAVLIALHAIVLTVILLPGSLYIDDFRAQAYAQGEPLLPFVFDSNGTHLTPLTRTVDWLQSRLFPLAHAPAVVVTVAVRVLLAAGVWRLLRVLFTPGWRLLVPLGVTLVTPALLPSSAWYRQSITGLAAAAALVWALDAHVRWHEEGRWRHVGAAVAATAVGLGCYEKAALVPVLLLGVSVAVFGGGTASGGGTGSGADAERSRGWRAGLVPVVATGLLVAVFVLVYRLGPYDQGTEVPLRPGALLELTGRALETLLPGLLGGPWTWRYPQPYYGMADPAAAAVTASFVVVGLGLLLALVRRPGQVFRAVFLAALWTFSSIGLVAVGRLSRVGMTLAEDYRLFADVSVALILCAALAVLPWRVGALGAAAPSAWWTAAARRLTGLAVRGRHLPLRAAAQMIGVVALLAVLAGSAVSTERFARAWWQNPAGAWTERMRTGLELASARPRLVPRTVPPEIVPGWVQPDFLDAPLVALVRPDARFHDANGPQLTLDPTGRPVQAQLLRLGGTPPATLCTATLQPGAREPARAAFGTPVPYDRDASVRLGLLVTGSTTIDVAVVTPEGQVAPVRRWSRDVLYQGPHTVLFPVPAGTTVSAVQVSSPDPDAAVCIASAEVVVVR